MDGTIETVLRETRTFPPPQDFQKKAVFSDRSKYEKTCKEASSNPVKFWEEAAKNVDWFEPWMTTLEWNEPFSKWFIGATTNASHQCLDRHLAKHADKVALLWEGEDGRVEKWTYQKLHAEVCRLSNALEKDLGLRPGDTAAIYMPLIPETIVAMLACARIGIAHSVIFAGFSSHAIRDRVNDADSKVIFCSDVGYRRGQRMDLLATVRDAVRETPGVRNTLVLKRESSTSLGKNEVEWKPLLEKSSPNHTAKPFSSEQPLFLLYTSGTTGKPKGIVHTTGGYLVGAITTSKWVFDLKDSDIYWCTADIGWITGHSYVVYGILGNGATALIMEGALNFPHAGRPWEVIDRHQVTILYTAPTAIRSFMRSGDDIPKKYSMKSLRLLGTVGEPINPEAWIWYHTRIGQGRCPIVDTWWQTETGAIMISAIPSMTTLKPGSATVPFPGIIADVVDENGKSCGPNQGGYLVIRHPWPSMLRTIHKDPERFKEVYWKRFPGMYFTGDGAHKDENGYFWIKGRVDDVINVSGHRLGTMEIESALVSHPSVAEAAVVGRPDDIKGQAVVAFVTPRDGTDVSKLKDFEKDLKAHVVQEIGSIARPDVIRFTKSLPKTRSGKIMRRLLKDLAAGREISGDTTTLENPGLVEFIDT